MSTNDERQAARIMLHASAVMFWGALGHLVRLYALYLTAWFPRLVRRVLARALGAAATVYARVPDRQRILRGHSAVAVGFSFGFGMVSGVNICIAGVIAARAAVGVG